MVIGEINGKAFGINKFLSLLDTELAYSYGEILIKNRKMTRDEAIAKLKESKELLDLELLTQEEYNALKEELTPIIRGVN
jgi:chaperonin cofactor prefoldin